MTPRYKLRTQLILLAVLPPLLWFGWTKYEAWRAEQERLTLLHEIPDGGTVYSGVPLPQQPQPIAPTVDRAGVRRKTQDRPPPQPGDGTQAGR